MSPACMRLSAKLFGFERLLGEGGGGRLASFRTG